MEFNARLLLAEVLTRPIAFHAVFARVGGGALAGLFLSQLFYWHDKGSDPDGWIWKPQKDWSAETQLSRPELERVRRQVGQRGLVEEKKVGLPAKLYYRLDVDALIQAIIALSATPKEQQTSLLEYSKLACCDTADKPAVKPHPIYEAEITTETTSEITKPFRAKRAKDPRHVLFRNACRLYAEHHKVELIWDVSEAKQLTRLLDAAPDLTLEEFQRWLQHRARSEGVTHGTRQRTYLSNISDYQQGPLDRFGKQKGNNATDRIGTVSNRSQQRTDGNVACAKAAYAEIIGGSDLPC